MLTLKAQILLSPAGQWMLRHKTKLLGVLGTLLFLFVWQGIQLYRSLSPGSKPLEELLTRWEKHPEDQNLYRELQKAVTSLSGPNPMRARIAQTLLSLGKAEEAKILARPSLEKLKSVDSAYGAFAEISLLIGNKQYQEALEKSVSLKEGFGLKNSILYGKNLVRIAFLQQMRGNRAGELAAWNELEEALGAKEKRATLQGLARRSSDVQAYLEERKKAL